MRSSGGAAASAGPTEPATRAAAPTVTIAHSAYVTYIFGRCVDYISLLRAASQQLRRPEDKYAEGPLAGSGRPAGASARRVAESDGPVPAIPGGHHAARHRCASAPVAFCRRAGADAQGDRRRTLTGTINGEPAGQCRAGLRAAGANATVRRERLRVRPDRRRAAGVRGGHG